MKRNTRKLITRNNHVVWVDISYEAISEFCSKNGLPELKHLDRILFRKYKGTVQGVGFDTGSETKKEIVLWIILDSGLGKASCLRSGNKELKKL